MHTTANEHKRYKIKLTFSTRYKTCCTFEDVNTLYSELQARRESGVEGGKLPRAPRRLGGAVAQKYEVRQNAPS